MHRTTVDDKKLLSDTVMSFANRETFGATARKTVSRSKSFMSVSSSSVLRKLPDDSEVKDPLEKEMEMYEEEYSLYLLRVLQSNMLREERERENEAKKCLVSLKKEYEDLLMENTVLYNEIRRIEIQGKSLQKLEENLQRLRKLSKALTETEFDNVLHNIGLALESNVNRLQLVGLTRKDIEEGFSKNLLGYHSDVYKLLKNMEEYAVEHGAVIPEIAEKINEIQSLHAENEKLKIRCTTHANHLRRKTIVSDYEKYFRLAAEECKDILEKLPEKRILHSFVNESLPQWTPEWKKPASSSTPAGSALTTEKPHREESKSQL